MQKLRLATLLLILAGIGWFCNSSYHKVEATELAEATTEEQIKTRINARVVEQAQEYKKNLDQLDVTAKSCHAKSEAKIGELTAEIEILRQEIECLSEKD